MLWSIRSLRAIKYPALAVALSLAAPGLISSAQQGPAALSEITLRGSVIDSTTKQPIARALVQLSDALAVLTDTNGSFEFPDTLPAPDTLRLDTITVRRPGYVSNQDQLGFQPSQNQTSNFQVSIRADMPPLTLPLTPEAVLTGRVTSPDSDFSDGVQVSAFRKSIENGRPKWQMAGHASTNNEGVFRIASLPAGTYLLHAESPPDSFFAAADNALSSGFPAVYYPGVTDVSAASSLTLSPGEHKQADITLLRQTLYPVTITVANAQPGDSFNIEISLAGGAPSQAPTRIDPSQLTAHTHIPPGRYLLTARVFNTNKQNNPLFGRTEFTVTAAPAYIRISVTPLRAIPVIIRKEFTSPPPQIIKYFGRINTATGVFVNLVDASSKFSGGAGAGGLEPVPGTTDDSSYQISNVPPGKYWVEAQTFPGHYISSISSGGVDLARDVLTVGAGGSSAPIEITLRNDTGSIEGTVTSTQSSPNAETHPRTIYAIPLFNTTSTLPTTNADKSGKFFFSLLAPGSYRVIASDTPLQIEFHNPEVLSALSSKGQVVLVEPGSDAPHVQLDLTPNAEPAQ